jgi:hypothetical protein
MTDRYAHLSETFLGEAAKRLDAALPAAINFAESAKFAKAEPTDVIPDKNISSP